MASSFGELEPGCRLGKWIIRKRIGSGGMGTVYQAFESVLGRDVALKTIEPRLVAAGSRIPEREILERFRREARAAAKLRHPNVRDVLSYEEIDGRPVIEMELLEGEALSEVLRRGPLRIPRAVDIIVPICAAVHVCHDEQIVHRDLKPDNIFVSFNRQLNQEVVKVLDFGVAKFPIAEDLTREGRLLGTPAYMSPEQAMGEEADARSDQYAMGCLLYHLLTGRAPFAKGKILVVLKAVQAGDFPRPRQVRGEIPQSLEDVVLRAMSLGPEARFPSVYVLGRSVLPFASPRVRERWKDYFDPEVAVRRAGTSAPAGASAGAEPTTKGARSDGSSARTMNEREIPTTPDGRFSATTVARTPAPHGEAVVASGEMDTKDGGGHTTPWSVSDTAAMPVRAFAIKHRVLLSALSLVGAATGALLHWASPGEPARTSTARREAVGTAAVVGAEQPRVGTGIDAARLPARQPSPAIAASSRAVAEETLVRDEGGNGGKAPEAKGHDSFPAVATTKPKTSSPRKRRSREEAPIPKEKPRTPSVEYLPDGTVILPAR